MLALELDHDHHRSGYPHLWRVVVWNGSEWLRTEYEGMTNFDAANMLGTLRMLLDF